MAQEVSVAKTAYQQCLTTMYALRRFGIKLGLETIRTILAALDDPQRNYSAIHIAGTNGKGSVATMLSTILMAAGYRVGRYTSPHLESFNERICIDNAPIEDEAVVAAYDRVRGVRNLKRHPTFFEFTTAMALDEFARRKVDWAMVETGMGGRLDATNTIQPAVSVITNISLEHKLYLGNTIAAIADEKAGIIKPGVPVVAGVAQGSAKARVQHNADLQKARLYLKGRDFRCRRKPGGSFTYYGMDHTWPDLKLSLAGSHQVDNASLVLAVCEILQRSDQVRIPLASIRSGLENSYWPGRLEVAHDAPHLILDGAHNLMAARVLARHLSADYKGRRITLVVGVLDDKPCESILKDLAGPCHRAIVTQPEINRAIPAEQLAVTARMYFKDVTVVPDVHQAVERALQDSSPDDVVCVAGSLYVVGEAKTALRRMGFGP
jgi:dihydrofolate synthase / folylpolyglutamate synthase